MLNMAEGKHLNISGIDVDFPFEPYQCQIAYMQKVMECLKMGKNGLLESPTGTGKTVCLLCASLAWLDTARAAVQVRSLSKGWKSSEKDDGESFANNLFKKVEETSGMSASDIPELGVQKLRIIYASRTHSQISQVMQELKRTPYSKHKRAAVIGSRDQLCIHPEVQRLESNSAKLYSCKAKVASRGCQFYNNLEEGKIFPELQGETILDIEDLGNLGKSKQCCPYFLAKEMTSNADIIFMPYNYLLDPKTRRAHGINLKNSVIIFDEAHNVEKICEESASFDLTAADLAGAIKDVGELLFKSNQMEKFNKELAYETTGLQDFTIGDVANVKEIFIKLEEQIKAIQISSTKGDTKPGHFIYQLFADAGISNDKFTSLIFVLDKILQHISMKNTGGALFSTRGTCLQKVADALKLVFENESEDPQGDMMKSRPHSHMYRVHIHKPQPQTAKFSDGWATRTPTGNTLSYWCFNPGFTMENLLKQDVRCVILTSGTLAPLKSFASELRISFPVRLENPHVIDENQVWVGTIKKGPDGRLLRSSYRNRSDEGYQTSLGQTIAKLDEQEDSFFDYNADTSDITRRKKRKIVVDSASRSGEAAPSEHNILVEQKLVPTLSYLSKLKKSLSKSNYGFWSSAIKHYVETHDFQALKVQIADLFADGHHDLLFDMLPFINPEHRTVFNDLCLVLTGRACPNLRPPIPHQRTKLPKQLVTPFSVKRLENEEQTSPTSTDMFPVKELPKKPCMQRRTSFSENLEKMWPGYVKNQEQIKDISNGALPDWILEAFREGEASEFAKSPANESSRGAGNAQPSNFSSSQATQIQQLNSDQQSDRQSNMSHHPANPSTSKSAACQQSNQPIQSSTNTANSCEDAPSQLPPAVSGTSKYFDVGCGDALCCKCTSGSGESKLYKSARCGHVACTSCWKASLRAMKGCPLCRQPQKKHQLQKLKSLPE